MQLEHILQAHGLIGRGGKSKDNIPPPPITNSVVVVIGNSLELTWTNPDDTDFIGVRIVRKTSGYPPSINDGDIVYEGNSQTFSDSNVTLGIVYYYRAFTYDFDKNYNFDTGQQVNGIIKLSQATPSVPTMASRTSTSITLDVISGCEYRIGSGAWQDSVIFSGLSLATSYAFYARKKETGTYYASPISASATFITDKGTQSAPAIPNITNLEYDRATVTGVTGIEVRIGTGTWYDSPYIFTGLSAETIYQAYARMKETTTHYASPISGPKGFTTPSDCDDTSGSPGPCKLIAGTLQQGYFGTVLASELWTGTQLSAAVGISQGTIQFDDTPWLKFALDGKILFRPMKAFRYSINYDAINTAGCVFGTKTVTKNGRTYKVRLMKGANKDPAGGYSGAINHNSEWNKLMLPIHIQAKDKSWAYPANVEDNVLYWGIDFTDVDLAVITVNGRYVWCQEVAESSSYRLLRGGIGVSYSGSTTPSGTGAYNGWAPVLEWVS